MRWTHKSPNMKLEGVMSSPSNSDLKHEADSAYVQARFGEAAALYSQLLDNDPTSPQLLRALGLSLIMDKRTDEGIAACHRAVELQGEEAESRYALGYGLGAAHRYDEAIAELDAALLYQPMHVAARQALVFALVSRAQELAPMDHIGAEQRFNRARKLDSKNPELLAGLLSFYVETAQKGKALKLIEEAEPSIRESPAVAVIISRLSDDPQYSAAMKTTLRSAKRHDSRPIAAPSSIQQIPCTKCGQLMPKYTVSCPHCSAGTSQTTMFVGQDRKAPRIWQEPLLTVLTVIWMAMAAFEIVVYIRPGGGPFSGYLLVLDGMRIGVGLIVLFRSDWISNAAKIVCYFTLIVTAAQIVIQAGLAHWGMFAFQFVQLAMTGMLLYLVNFCLGD